jgi:hypothetical protein
MTDKDRDIIREFAGGSMWLRDQALFVYRCEVKISGRARGTPEKDFMAEVDNPCPDYILRQVYRDRLVRSGKVGIEE